MRTPHSVWRCFRAFLLPCSCFPCCKELTFGCRMSWWVKERTCFCMSVCVTLLWWDFQVGAANPQLCSFISPWTTTVGNAVSLNVFLLNQPVWSLGEGQAPEELDKPIETPPLSILLIEQPQSATVSVGELTIAWQANRRISSRTYPVESVVDTSQDKTIYFDVSCFWRWRRQLHCQSGG